MSSAPDFIELYENVFSADFCAQAMTRFDRSGKDSAGRVGGGVFPDLKNSRDIQITGQAEWNDVEGALNNALLHCLRLYLRKYPYTLIAPLMLEHQSDPSSPRVRMTAEHVAEIDDDRLNSMILTCFRPGAINIQRYTANQGGYPYWHCEHYPQDQQCEALHRTLLWTAYLNDDFEQGETEFFYQARKIKPKTGALVIAPASFTHTHRGNMPLGGNKYIATSWVLFQRAEKIFAKG